MFRRFMEGVVARGNPLAGMQADAVKLQDTHGSWPRFFFEELSREQVAEAARNPHLAEAGRLYRHILSEGRDRLAPGALGVTGYKLGLLMHRQGRLEEARRAYEEAVRVCRLQPEATDTAEWALVRALFRLAELTVRQDPRRGADLFAESRRLAEKRRDSHGLGAANRAIEFFGLGASPVTAHAGRKDTEPFDLVFGDAATYARRPSLSMVVRIVVVLSAAAVAAVVAIRMLGSLWLGLFAGYAVASVCAPLLSAMPPDIKGRMMRVYTRAVLIAVVVVALLQYVVQIPWLAAVAGVLTVSISARRAYEGR
jgi:hypothetical protein